MLRLFIREEMLDEALESPSSTVLNSSTMSYNSRGKGDLHVLYIPVQLAASVGMVTLWDSLFKELELQNGVSRSAREAFHANLSATNDELEASIMHCQARRAKRYLNLQAKTNPCVKIQ
jgi:hypothetical protein